MPQLNEALSPNTTSTQVIDSSYGGCLMFLYSHTVQNVACSDKICHKLTHLIRHKLHGLPLLTQMTKFYKTKSKSTTLCLRVGRALLALTLTNQHGRAVRSAVQTAPRTTSSRVDTDLMRWNSDGSSRRKRLSDSTSRLEKHIGTSNTEHTMHPQSYIYNHTSYFHIVKSYVCVPFGDN